MENTNKENDQVIDPHSPKYQPSNYKEMDDWLNAFSRQQWTALLGAYTAGGMYNVIDYLRRIYAFNLERWRDKDLRHFFNSRKLIDFRSRLERRKGKQLHDK